jgi:hypothetical protein
MEGDRPLSVALQPHDDVACVVLDDLGVQLGCLRHLRLLHRLRYTVAMVCNHAAQETGSERVQAIRSAITVAGMSGHCLSSS